MLRLPPFPFSRLLEALKSAASIVNTDKNSHRDQHFGLSQIPVWKDIHLALIRILEGVDVVLLELATLAGFGSAVQLGPSDVYKYAFYTYYTVYTILSHISARVQWNFAFVVL